MSHTAKLTKYDIHIGGVYACSTWSRNRQGALASFNKAGRKWAGSQWLATRTPDQPPCVGKIVVSLSEKQS